MFRGQPDLLEVALEASAGPEARAESGTLSRENCRRLPLLIEDAGNSPWGYTTC